MSTYNNLSSKYIMQCQAILLSRKRHKEDSCNHLIHLRGDGSRGTTASRAANLLLRGNTIRTQQTHDLWEKNVELFVPFMKPVLQILEISRPQMPLLIQSKRSKALVRVDTCSDQYIDLHK